jgi:hypothetical protein
LGWRASSLEWWNQERKYFELFVWVCPFFVRTSR